MQHKHLSIMHWQTRNVFMLMRTFVWCHLSVTPADTGISSVDY